MKSHDKNKQPGRICNFLANDPKTITPFLEIKLAENKKNGAKFS